MIPLNTYNEFKNWLWTNLQKQVPWEADKCNIQSQSHLHHMRRAICELVGNGVGIPHDAFTIDKTVPSDPTIKAGSVFICGLKVSLENDTTYDTQPFAVDAPAIGDVENGLFFLSVIIEEIDQTDDPEIVDPALSVECVKPHRIRWVVKWQSSGSLPTPADDEMVLALWIFGDILGDYDVRNSGAVAAGVDTGFQGLEGGRLGGGHYHELSDTFVAVMPTGDPSPDYSTTEMEAVMNDIVGRIRTLESGGAFHIDQAGGTGGTYGVLSGSINGGNKVFTVSLSKYEDGTTEVWHNVSRIYPDGDDYSESNPDLGQITLVIAPVPGDKLLVRFHERVS